MLPVRKALVIVAIGAMGFVYIWARAGTTMFDSNILTESRSGVSIGGYMTVEGQNNSQTMNDRSLAVTSTATPAVAVDSLAGSSIRVRLEDILEQTVPRTIRKRKYPRCSKDECLKEDGNCWCNWRKGPAGVPRERRPQIVFLTFDDYVTVSRLNILKRLKLLTGERTNPNGCPIAATFFINDVKHFKNNYTLTRQLYDLGHEIATHSLTHSTNYVTGSKEFWRTEMVEMRDKLHHLAVIPLEDLRGMRAPYLNMGGDNQFSVIQENGFSWDSSAITPGYDNWPEWPFEVGRRYVDCRNANCPKFHRFEGFWEVPVSRWIGPDSSGEDGCDTADMCDSTMPEDREDTLGFFWENFLTTYRGNRAPFPLCLHAFSFANNAENGPVYLEALNDFLDEITKLEDVYLVSISQVVAWMEDPQPLDKLLQFEPWKRSCGRR